MRSLQGDQRHARRVQVLLLRDAGRSYADIALATGLSRTGVFNICSRRDAAAAGKLGARRLLQPGPSQPGC